MRVLFDQGTPVPLRGALFVHEVVTAYERGWSTLRNGELLRIAEAEGIDVLVTTDANPRYQQNLANRKLAIVVLTTTSWPRIRSEIGAITEAIGAAAPGGYVEVKIP